MTTLYKIILSGVLIALIQGCAPTYGCALKNEDGYCASMEQTFHASRGGGGDSESVFTSHEDEEGDNSDDKENADNKNVEQLGLSKGKGKPPSWGMPVYDPGKPWRVYMMPWTDGNGILHGGEYMYIATKPKWNYGTLRDNGKASGLLGPLDNSPKGTIIPDNQNKVNGKVAPELNLLGR